MPKSSEIGYPPDALDENEFIVTIVKSRGNTFDVEVAESEQERLKQVLPEHEGLQILVGMSSRLRNQFFVRRGGLALAIVGEKGKLQGTIVNIVADRRSWQKMPYWPQELVQQKEENDLDLPPSDDEYDDEYDSEEEDLDAEQPTL